MVIVVFGASGGTGKAVIEASLAKGCAVKAFVRTQASIEPRAGLRILRGDVTYTPSVLRAISADDRIVIALGNSQNPLRRMLGQPRTTSRDVCSIGTSNVIAAMAACGAKRLIVVSAFGVGDTRAQAPWFLRLIYAAFLRDQMADKEEQEQFVKDSGLEWTIVQPVALTNGPPAGRWSASRSGRIGRLKISRQDVADFILAELLEPAHVNATTTLSGAR